MQLNPAVKAKILESTTAVYHGYLALDLVNSMKDKIIQAVTHQQTSFNIDIQGQSYRVNLRKNGASYSLDFPDIPKTEDPLPAQEISHYLNNKQVTPAALQLLAKEKLTIKQKQGVWQIYNDVGNPGQPYLIGGAKIALYRSHLVTLLHIIDKIKTEKNTSNLLVALTTGSGKTFVQALWMLVLSRAGLDGYFGVPKKLVNQFRSDLLRLLPEIPTGISISASDDLIDKDFDAMMQKDPDTTFLSFDEQHLLMRWERKRLRLIELSGKFLSMFLTATPNDETYRLAGKRPVAIMSSGQKEEAGQGQFPNIVTLRAENMRDKNHIGFRFWRLQFWLGLLRIPALRAYDAIESDRSSVATAFIEQFSFLEDPAKDPKDPLTMPWGRKMLLLIDDNETLVDVWQGIQNRSMGRMIYRDGNLQDGHRGKVASFFEIPNVDEQLADNDLVARQEAFKQKDKNELREKISDRSMSRQLLLNQFSAMNELMLRAMSGMSTIELNQERKKDIHGFARELLHKGKIQELTKAQLACYLYEAIVGENWFDIFEANPEKRKFVDSIVNEWLPWLTALNGYWLYATRDHNAFGREKSSLIDLLENNALDDELARKFLYKKVSDESKRTDLPAGGPEATAEVKKFSDFSNRYSFLSVMQDMTHSETPIETGRPFLGFKQEEYDLYDEKGFIVEKAKRRPKTTIETLDDTTKEYCYTPVYLGGNDGEPLPDLGFQEHVADQLFKLGLVGIYASNRKTEGFSSDVNTVVNFAERRESPNNNPDTLIQGIGRNRGLDETIKPAYVHILGRNQHSDFDLSNLRRKDYYREHSQAVKSYQRAFLNELGNRVGHDLINWYYANLGADQQIDKEALRRQTMLLIIKALRKINDKNKHDIELSRAQFSRVMATAIQSLDKEITRLNKPYQLSRFVRFLSVPLNLLSRAYLAIRNIGVNLRLRFYKPSDEADASTQAFNAAYRYILTNSNYSNLMADGIIARELKDWAKGLEQEIKSTLGNQVDQYLSKDVKERLWQYRDDTLIPLLQQLVKSEDKETLRQAIEGMPYLLVFINKNKALLQDLNQVEIKDFPVLALQLITKIPGFEQYKQDDIVNYRQQLDNFQDNFAEQLKADKPFMDNFCAKTQDFLVEQLPLLADATLFAGDAQKLKTAVQDTEQLKSFISQQMEEPSAIDPRGLMESFAKHFKLQDFKLPDEHKEDFVSGLSAIQSRVESNPWLCLDPAVQMKIKQQFTELLSCLVNGFPLADRPRLFKEALVCNLDEFISKNRDFLMGIQIEQPGLATAILEKLGVKDIPGEVNVEQEKQKTKQTLSRLFMDLNPLEKPSVEEIGKGLLNILKSGRVLKTIKNPYEFLKPKMQEMLASDDFLNSWSMVFPYQVWDSFRQYVKSDPSIRESMAADIIQQLNVDQKALEEAGWFLALFRKHSGLDLPETEAEIVRLPGELTGQMQRIKADPLLYLNGHDSQKIAGLMREKFLPLLALFIPDQEQRKQFLAIQRNDHDLIIFLSQHRKEIESLDQDNPEPVIYQMIAGLWKEVQLKNPEKVPKEVEQKFVIKIIELYLLNLPVNLIFNAADCQIWSHYLQGHVSELVDYVVKDINNYPPESMLQRLITHVNEKTGARLRNLKDRVESMEDFFSELQDDKEAILDPEEYSKFIFEHLLPMFSHPDFIAVCTDNLVKMPTEHLAAMLMARNLGDDLDVCTEKAEELQAFLDLLQARKWNTVREHYFSFDKNLNVDELPGTKLLELTGDLLDDLVNCHCYYRQHNRKGNNLDPVENIRKPFSPPALVGKLSEGLKELRMSNSSSFFNRMSKKVGFLQGVKRGLQTSEPIFAQAHAHEINDLTKVRNEILVPMKNEVGANWLLFTLNRWLTSFLNLFKSAKDADSFVPVTESTIDQLRRLKPMTPADAAKPDSPKDVLGPVKETIKIRGRSLFKEGPAENNKEVIVGKKMNH